MKIYKQLHSVQYLSFFIITINYYSETVELHSRPIRHYDATKLMIIHFSYMSINTTNLHRKR